MNFYNLYVLRSFVVVWFAALCLNNLRRLTRDSLVITGQCWCLITMDGATAMYKSRWRFNLDMIVVSLPVMLIMRLLLSLQLNVNYIDKSLYDRHITQGFTCTHGASKFMRLEHTKLPTPISTRYNVAYIVKCLCYTKTQLLHLILSCYHAKNYCSKV